MPSSHGGGGSHGGSGFSHSSSSSDSSEIYHGISYRPYPGARRYVYVDRYGRNQTFYSNTQPKKKSLFVEILPVLLFILVPLIVAGIIFLCTMPCKLESDKCYFHDTYIQDNANIIDDSKLQPLLENFYDKTGVQPYIYTIEKSTLVSNGYNFNLTGLTNKAYNKYVNTFRDEGHWMIAIVVENSNDWYWCDMAGDDTNRIVTDKFFSIFQETMKENINKKNNFTTCLVNSFKKANDIVLTSKSIDWVAVIIPSAILLIYTFFGVLALISTIKSHNQLDDFFTYAKNNSNTTLNGEEIYNQDIDNNYYGVSSDDDFIIQDDDY